MYVYNPQPTSRKRLMRQTPCGGIVVVVTSRIGDRWETEVMGGPLDGWSLEATDKAGADCNHDGAVALVKGATN